MAQQPLKLVVLPRERGPYQRLLYTALCSDGGQVRYAGELTPSHTANVALLPLELAVLRALGWRIVHLHWVFAFELTCSDRFPQLRRIAQLWFALVLAVIRVLGFRLVWTAHNVLPHEPVFADDRAARRRLAHHADLVLVHSASTLAALEQIGARPRRAAIVAPGPLGAGVDPLAIRAPGADGPPLRLLFFGQVREYKGVEELLTALSKLPAEVPVSLVVAGPCPDRSLAARLRRAAGASPHPVELRLEYVPDGELAALLAAADVVVLPFREVTGSGSLTLAMGYGRAVLVPELPAFEDLPASAVVAYDGSVSGLTAAIEALAREEPERLAQVGAHAGRYAAGLSWERAAEQTRGAIEALG